MGSQTRTRFFIERLKIDLLTSVPACVRIVVKSKIGWDKIMSIRKQPAHAEVTRVDKATRAFTALLNAENTLRLRKDKLEKQMIELRGPSELLEYAERTQRILRSKCW